MGETECVAEAANLAKSVADDYGKQDALEYYQVGGHELPCSWRFAEGNKVELNNMMMTATNCTLTLSFSTKAEADAWK